MHCDCYTYMIYVMSYIYILIIADTQKRLAQNDQRASTFQDWKRQSRGSLAASFTMKLRLRDAKRLGPYETGLEIGRS